MNHRVWSKADPGTGTDRARASSVAPLDKRALGLTLVLSGAVIAHVALASDPEWIPRHASPAGLTIGEDRILDVLEVEGDGTFDVRWDEGAITLHGRLPAGGEGEGVRLPVRHQVHNARHVWVPHLAPEPGFVIGDHAFRSPAVVLADESIAVALIPDLDDAGAAFRAGWRACLDYDHRLRTVTLIAGNYRVEGHVFYKPASLTYTGQPVQLRLHVVASREPEDLANPYGLAARWIWQRWGRPLHREGGTQRAPLSRYADYIRRWAFSSEGWGDTVWQEFEVGERHCGGPAFIVDVAQHPSIPVEKRRWREQLSIWNQAWFSTQRCANGLMLHAKRTESEDLARRARLSTELALAAPQNDGLFPAVYTTAQPGWQWYSLYEDTPGWEKAYWSNSDRRPREASADACHILDAAFTARLLLEWDAIVGGDPEALDYVTRFADRLCRLQRPSGAFPGWVEPDGRVVEVLAEGPETAMGTTLLLELLERFPEGRRCRDSAVAALDYLEKGPVAKGRWEDYETYFSCNRWGTPDRIGKRVQRNGVYKQNTLSIFWCAEAFLAASRVLEAERYLDVGRRCLDELSLYQQVWDPPFIAAPSHGGFGVMNTDGEWLDARQSLFAPLYLDYYRATGHPEYFERGVAALRASFAMLYCPENKQVARQYELRHPMFGAESYGFMMENFAHTGPAKADGSGIGTFTIYTWGNGAALATAAKVHARHGDLYVDSPRQAAFGIDGCTARVEGDSVVIEDRYEREALVAVYTDGTRRTVELDNGKARLPLWP